MQQAESGMFTEFIAFVKQQLHTQTDSQKRFSRFRLFHHDPVKPRFPQFIRRVAKRADASPKISLKSAVDRRNLERNYS